MDIWIVTRNLEAQDLMLNQGGGRRYDGTFGYKGDNANFWTATEYSKIQAWGRQIYSDYSTVHRYRNAKSDGFSVRCVKDK